MEVYITQILIIIAINIILAVSLNLINGMTGQFSLGHAGFMAVGAYTSAVLAKTYGVNILLAILVGAAVAGVVGFIIGFPVLRLKGDYLAIVTLGFGEIIRVIILNMKITGGAKGLPGIPGGINLLISYTFAIATVIIIRNIMLSSEGRAFLSIREDEIAAEAMGVNITRYKVLAFIIGAFFAGIAGGVYAHFYQFLKPDSFNIFKTVDILLMVVLGGMGSITGSIIAAIILTIVPELLRGFSEYRMVVYSLTLIILMIARPDGILGKKEITDIISFKKRGA
ncbi:branched-chain amino acid ABC transporter permease [Haliovirga abyssi]|uniref:Branched-chain amino acid ABC transporter permease n=1 Tax=Haliovirga abyssi TaxID=2996794 RepID=A0AAU9DBH7_9FUSO|nr:branched-chain amino acid ABC transporter permease [Haliovirga abyssi]BDU49463.1 branched-chain amino acid ABC transporter permease [Haliovirga abyssi]